MKILLGLLLLTGCAYAQSPTKSIRRDSLPQIIQPGESTPGMDSPERMPNARPTNSFYRDHSDPANVMRATLDNMPIKVPDSSTYYTMLRSSQKYLKPDELLMPFLKPMPRIIPKKFP